MFNACNAYGINDNYDPFESIFPALIKKLLMQYDIEKMQLSLGNGNL